MIPEKITDYVKTYENFIDPQFCKATVDKCSELRWERHSYYDEKDGLAFSIEDDFSVSYDQPEEIKKIEARLWYAIERYIMQDFGSFNWFLEWRGYTHIRINRYDTSTRMNLHCDHIQSMFDGERRGVPILTILGALNDDYEGGELMMFGDKQINFPTGSVIVFPSNFMFPHEVKPVKDGVRYSYVSWVW